jgi:hypothetical protein
MFCQPIRDVLVRLVHSALYCVIVEGLSIQCVSPIRCSLSPISSMTLSNRVEGGDCLLKQHVPEGCEDPKSKTSILCNNSHPEANYYDEPESSPHHEQKRHKIQVGALNRGLFFADPPPSPLGAVSRKISKIR